MSLPFSGRKVDFKRTVTGIASYLTSNPQLLDFEKGGSNVLFFGNKTTVERTNLLNILTSLIPTELKSARSPFYYTTLQEDKIVSPVNSIEVSPAYLNSKEVPIHLPIYFDLNFKKKSYYLSDFKHYAPMLTTYILDGLMFQPEIPESLDKHMQDNIQEIFDTVTFHDTLPYQQNIGSSLSKISLSQARFNHKLEVSKDDLKNSTELITESFKDAVTYMKFGYDIDRVYRVDMNSAKLLKLIKEMVETEVPTTIPEVFKRSNFSEWDFERALTKLSNACYIYFLSNNTIRLLEQ